jgi:hypothetical protein
VTWQHSAAPVNRLTDLRRAGTKLTREIIREVAASFRADAQLLIQHWA